MIAKRLWNMTVSLDFLSKTFLWLFLFVNILLWTVCESYVVVRRDHPRCIVGRYRENGRCKLCHMFCGRDGCSGPGHLVGPGGCNSCWRGKELPDQPGVIQCISYFTHCLPGYYLRRVPVTDPGPMAGYTLCRLCNPLCSTCSGPGAPYCLTCKYFKLHGRCVERCPPGTVQDSVNNSCNRSSGRFRRRHTYPYPDVTDI